MKLFNDGYTKYVLPEATEFKEQLKLVLQLDLL